MLTALVIGAQRSIKKKYIYVLPIFKIQIALTHSLAHYLHLKKRPNMI